MRSSFSQDRRCSYSVGDGSTDEQFVWHAMKAMDGTSVKRLQSLEAADKVIDLAQQQLYRQHSNWQLRKRNNASQLLAEQEKLLLQNIFSE